eukprot:1649284-Amphidinium_carterae.1
MVRAVAIEWDRTAAREVHQRVVILRLFEPAPPAGRPQRFAMFFAWPLLCLRPRRCTPVLSSIAWRASTRVEVIGAEFFVNMHAIVTIAEYLHHIKLHEEL